MSATSLAASEGIVAFHLRCMAQSEAMGVDVPNPYLSWQLRSPVRNDRQTAYRVLVATTALGLAKDDGDAWDSGKVSSDTTFAVAYSGKPLTSFTSYYWKVRVWDAAGVQSGWSEAATWTCGILAPTDWTAKWISSAADAVISQPAYRPMPIFRRDVKLAKAVRRATAIVCGLGHFELHINGEKIGDHVLDPGWTQYRQTCLYVTFDVTAQLRQGDNAIGVMLGNGFYNLPKNSGRYQKLAQNYFGQPKLTAEIKVVYEDGTSEIINTDQKWESLTGPITFSSVYGGEDFDARLLPDGWDRPDFAAAVGWKPSAIVEGPGGALFGLSRSGPPLKIIKTFGTVKFKQAKHGRYVYDFGQNASALPQIMVTGAAGATVKITPGERLFQDGTVDQTNSGGPAYFDFTLADSNAVQTWSPRFTYYGYRWLEISGAVPQGEPNPQHLPVINDAKSKFITSSSDSAGEFSCSNNLFNRTATIIRAAMRSNLQSVLTDCPHRERLGWLEQIHLVGPALMYNFDTQALFLKTCDDMSASQYPNGMVPNTAPQYDDFGGSFRDSPEWNSAAVLIPWQVYQWYGDRALLIRQYDSMVRYIKYLGTRAKEDTLDYGLGDWYDLGPHPPGEAQLTPRSLTATAFYYRDVTIMARISRLLDKPAEVDQYDMLAGKIRNAFNRDQYHPDTHTYARGSQTALAIPLVFGLVPQSDRPGVMDALVTTIRKNDNKLTAGDIGYRYLLRALADGGRSDVIFDMNIRSDRPGYGYILATGATTLTEGWDGSGSQNHFMLGHIMEWFYSNLAGIQQAPDAIAFDRVIIQPTPVGDVTWAKARYATIRGLIESSWTFADRKFTLDVTIPPGATAVIRLPKSEMSHVTESGNSLDRADAVSNVRPVGDGVSCDIGSGTYHFVAGP